MFTRNVFKVTAPLLAFVLFGSPSLVWGKAPELEKKLKHYNSPERVGRRQFNQYVLELESRTSSLAPQDEERFLKESVERKIYKSKEKAKEALEALKGRLKVRLASLKTQIGFTTSASPTLKPYENSGPTRNTIGFSKAADPTPIRSSSDELLKEPHKVGFNVTTDKESQAPSPTLPQYINSMKIEPKAIAINVDPTALQAELAADPANKSKPIHEMVRRLFNILPSENWPRIYVLSEGHKPTPPESLKYSTMTIKELSSEVTIGEVFKKTIQWIGKAKNVTFRIPLEGLTPEKIDTIFNTAKGEKGPAGSGAKTLGGFLTSLVMATSAEVLAQEVDQNHSVTEAGSLVERTFGIAFGDLGKPMVDFGQSAGDLIGDSGKYIYRQLRPAAKPSEAK